MFDGVLYCFCFVFTVFLVSCPCMAINVSVHYNGGLLPDIILLSQCCYHRGTRLNALKRFCLCRSLQPMIPPKRFDIFPPDWGMLRRSRCVQIFLSRNYEIGIKMGLFMIFRVVLWALYKNNLKHPAACANCKRRVPA